MVFLNRTCAVEPERYQVKTIRIVGIKDFVLSKIFCWEKARSLQLVSAWWDLFRA